MLDRLRHRRSPARISDELEPDFYRLSNPDLAALSDQELIEHWSSSGRHEGRLPSRDALAEGFRKHGLSLEDFDGILYLKLYPDVLAAGIKDPFGAAAHYITSGLREGRTGRATLTVSDGTRDDDEIFAFERSVTTVRHWNDLREQAERDDSIRTRRRYFTDVPSVAPEQPEPTDHGTSFDAAVLVSLYRTDDYLDGFLGNMEEQTAFHRCEFDIVLVAPSPLERDLCERFADRHRNVRLTIDEEMVGIYEAWNAGITATSARYLTNANADDLRSPRSLELQIDFLDTHPDVDIAYQDMYLSPVNGPSWDVIERIGFRTNFGDVSTRSLLQDFNTPANGPMWRRTLHDRIGLFDASYRSAGDWEFWIRCSINSASFAKMDSMHFCYFINERGMSRQVEGPAALESRRVMETYGHLV